MNPITQAIFDAWSTHHRDQYDATARRLYPRELAAEFRRIILSDASGAMVGPTMQAVIAAAVADVQFCTLADAWQQRLAT